MLTLRNLSVFYDENQVVHAINLNVSPGECVVLTGESGSGKSSIINAVNGLGARYDKIMRTLKAASPLMETSLLKSKSTKLQCLRRRCFKIPKRIFSTSIQRKSCCFSWKTLECLKRICRSGYKSYFLFFRLLTCLTEAFLSCRAEKSKFYAWPALIFQVAN